MEPRSLRTMHRACHVRLRSLADILELGPSRQMGPRVAYLLYRLSDWRNGGRRL